MKLETQLNGILQGFIDQMNEMNERNRERNTRLDALEAKAKVVDELRAEVATLKEFRAADVRVGHSEKKEICVRLDRVEAQADSHKKHLANLESKVSKRSNYD